MRCRPNSDRCSVDVAEQLGFEDELALLVLFGGLVGFVILPAHGFLALAAGNVTHDVSACGHVTFAGLAWEDVHDIVEEKGLAMLTAKVLYHVSPERE